MAASKILVVDDEQDLVWAVKYTLSDEGYKVLTASNGVKAMAAAQQHHPDLIVLDIIMPEMDGVQVCHRLRRDPGLAAVPILFLTMRDTIEDRVNGLDEGGDDYLVKPFDFSELKARIRALLRRSKAGQPASTTVPSSLLILDQLRMDLWYVRAFTASAYRKSLIATSLAVRGRVYLEEAFVSGRDTRAAGMIYEVESELLKSLFPNAVWKPADVLFIGENEQGAHVRVHYFAGALAP